uniref:Uncharacterized protein n=1 Tax=Knipowitschia caucasica TaxID=637954 RepID=A0AAV2KAN5_KNICA
MCLSQSKIQSYKAKKQVIERVVKTAFGSPLPGISSPPAACATVTTSSENTPIQHTDQGTFKSPTKESASSRETSAAGREAVALRVISRLIPAQSCSSSPCLKSHLELVSCTEEVQRSKACFSAPWG